MAQTDRIPPRIKVLGFLMRRMPTGIRKFQWWWDCLYRSINGKGFDDDVVIDSQGATGLHEPVRSQRLGCKVMLDLQIWSERRTYFSGSYFQNDVEHLFPLILRREGSVP
jgi:hypothetical protein